MKDLNKGFAKVLFFFVAAVLMIWTGRMTFTLLSDLLPDLLYAGLFGLVLFEGGLIAWLYMFIYGAEGQGQRITSILLTIFDLAGVGLVSMAKLYLSGQELAEIPQGLGTLALWTVVLATFVNLVGVTAYHLLDPGAVEQIAMQAQRDKLRSRTLEIFSQKVDGVADQVSDQLAEVMRDDLLAGMKANLNGKDKEPENPIKQIKA